MKAIEARTKAIEVNTRAINSQYATIIKAISEACNQGKYEVYVYETIQTDVRGKLTADGFYVGKEQFDRNETLVKITWSM